MFKASISYYIETIVTMVDVSMESSLACRDETHRDDLFSLQSLDESCCDLIAPEVVGLLSL